MSVQKKFEESKEKLQGEVNDTKDYIQKSVQSGVSKTKKFLSRLLLITIIGAIICGGLYMLYANFTFSDGSRTGYLVKISKKGMIFKTYEGQLNVGGIDTGGDGTGLGNIWNFSVTDKAVYEKIQEFEGKKVKLHYKEIIQPMPWQGDTKYFIDDVQLNE